LNADGELEKNEAEELFVERETSLEGSEARADG
jgi:hypothetical protein